MDTITTHQPAVTESQWRVLFAGSPTGILVADVSGKHFLLANPAICRMLGYSEAELLTLGVADIHPDEAMGRVREAFEAQLRGEQPLVPILPCRRKDGSIIQVMINAAPLVVNGQQALAGFFTNVTEHTRREEKLRQSEEKYRRLLEGLGNRHCVFSHTAEGIFLYASPSFQALFGIPAADIIGQDWRQITMTPESLKAGEEADQRVLSERCAQTVELTCFHADGTERIIEVFYGPVLEEGQVVRMEGVCTDVTDRKHVEAELRASRELFTLFMRYTPVYTFIKEVDAHAARPIAVSDNFAKMLGVPASSMLGKTMEELFPPEFAQKITADDLAVVASGQVFEQDETLNGRDYATIKFPIIRENGTTLLAGFTIDISERKRAESQLAHMHELMQYVISHAQTAIAVHDKEMRYIYVSDQYLKQYHVTEKDIIGKHHYEVFPDLPQKWREVHARVLAGAVEGKDADPYVREDGSIEWTRWECRPWYEDDGTIGGLIVYTEVITERVRREEALRTSEERFRSIVSTSGEWIWAIDLAGIHTFSNPAVERILGYSPEEITGHDLQNLLHEEDLPQLGEIFGTAIAEQQGWTGKVLRWRRKDGTWCYLESNAVPIFDNEGRLSGFQGTDRDITERKQAEAEHEKLQAQLTQAQKMESVGRLAGGVAHDFNNMLSVILGHAEMALDLVAPNQPLFDDLTEIRQAAHRSAALTRQLLAFARKQTASPVVLNLNETVHGMLKMLHRLIGEDIELVWLPDENAGRVKMDPSQIDQILANLCVNARDAIAGIGKINISTGCQTFSVDDCAIDDGLQPGNYAMFSVSDSGCGMDEETLNKIFEPFFTTKELGKGTGLGLATVYGIVKQNNGQIKVASSLGNGTTFTIYLPQHVDKAAQQREEGAPPPSRRGHETILLVEDEPGLLRMTTMMLERSGYTVLAAASPGDGLRLAEAHPGRIDLLLTDVVMPEMNGRDLAKNLLAIYPDVKRLFMSGYTADVIARHGVLDPGVHFLQKPFDMNALQRKLREALDAE